MWGQIAALGLQALPALGGLFGGSDYRRPAGTIGTDQVLSMLRQGMSLEEIMAMGPMSSRFMANSQRKLMKAGLSAEDIQKLRAGPGAFGGGGAGPMGMEAFQGLLPGLFSNPAVFSNPAAQGWLQSLFPSGPAAGAPSAPPSPGFQPWVWSGSGRDGPGPAPNPMLGLQSLAGPFGNGGGPLVPPNFPSGPRDRARISPFRGLMS